MSRQKPPRADIFRHWSTLESLPILKRFGFDGSSDFKFPEEKVTEINKELFEILEIESEVAVSQIWMADLEKHLPQATPALLEALYPIISEEEI